MDVWLSVGEVSNLEKITQQAVRKNIKQGKYYKIRQVKSSRGGRGGKEWQVHLSCLSEAARVAYIKRMGEALLVRTSSPSDAFVVPESPPEPSAIPSSPTPLSLSEMSKALARADLVRLYLAHLRRYPRGRKGHAREEFARAYNTGAAYPKLFSILGPVSWKTLERWKMGLREHGDAFRLADSRGRARRGRRAISQKAQRVLLQCALHPNRPALSEAIRMARAVMRVRGVEDGLSDATYRRFLQTWSSRHYDEWVFLREGAKAWNDKVAFFIERNLDLIQVGDILVADGHTLNFEIINPFTGKPKRMTLILWYDMRSNYPLGWEIMPTENTQAISSALRWAILRLGKIPKVAYLDRGKAFGARFFHGVDLEQEGFTGLFGRLGIKTIFAWPYHAQSKTVERFFRTFGELERWMPTYVGTSIDTKPPRLKRGEKLHRMVYEKVTRGGPITLEQAHWAIATWFDEYVQRPQRGHLKGRCPLEVFEEGRGPGVDPAELAFLMMSQEVKSIRREGIHLLGRTYYDPALYGRKHPVLVRYDLQERGSILVYELDGALLCEARAVEGLHPAAEILGTDEDRARLREAIALKREQERRASRSARAFLKEEILPEYERRLREMGIRALPAESPPPKDPPPLTEQDKARIEREVEELAALQRRHERSVWEQLPEMPDEDRYEKLLELEAQGEEIPPEERTFMRFFEQSEAYRRLSEYYKQYRLKMALLYVNQEVRHGRA